MSGGSYDYAYCRMADGELDKAAIYVDSAQEDIAKVIAEPVVAYDYTEHKSEKGAPYRVEHRREPTDRERLLTELGLGALRGRVDAFAATLAKAQQQAKDLADLFRALEWMRSGDYSTDSVQEFAREWAEKRLGLDSKETP